MSVTHKIAAELYLEDFELIAVHSNMTDYSLAYHLNRAIPLQLKRSANDLCFDKELRFSIFEWADEINDDHWTLIGNQCKVERQSNGAGLFRSATTIVAQQLVPEKREVDFFIKIETDRSDLLAYTLERINSIHNVVTAYAIVPETLKSKKNLIF